MRGGTVLRLSILAAACLATATGCTSTRKAEDRLLSRHAVHETRMSSQPQEGYTNAGVWRIRGVSNTVYLAGTAHVISEDQVPFPSPYYAAYRDSQEVYIEFDADVSWFTKLRLLPKVVRWANANRDVMTCPKDKTLSDYLPTETIQQLNARYRRDFGRERMTPLSLLFINEMGVLAATNAATTGVEQPFEILSHRDRKPLRVLDDSAVIETALLALDAMIPKLRREIEERGADTVVREAMLGEEKDENSIWRRGDLAIVARMHEEMKNDSPTVYEKALPERNRKWLPKLKTALHGRKNVMVLVGVAHLGGKDSLLDLLRDAGFPAEQMYGLDRPPVPGVPAHN